MAVEVVRSQKRLNSGSTCGFVEENGPHEFREAMCINSVVSLVVVD